MRVIMLTVFVCTVLNVFSMRQIHKSVELWNGETEAVMACVRHEDRRFILDEIKVCRASNVDQFPVDLRQFYKGVYESELCSDTYLYVDLLFHSLFYKYSTSDKNFETRVAKCMSIPYVRESQTGLAVETLIKRLENIRILEIFGKSIYTKKTSVLQIFTQEALDAVRLMNNEWSDHHDDPEYDHGAAKYWFADLDSDLETEIQRVEPILQKIASQWLPTANRQRARNILYDWREYFSENYEEYAY